MVINNDEILAPVVLPQCSRHVVHRAAWLVSRFHAEFNPAARGNASQLYRRMFASGPSGDNGKGYGISRTSVIPVLSVRATKEGYRRLFGKSGEEPLMPWP
jgi:hypothetical protein